MYEFPLSITIIIVEKLQTQMKSSDTGLLYPVLIMIKIIEILLPCISKSETIFFLMKEGRDNFVSRRNTRSYRLNYTLPHITRVLGWDR